MDVWHTKRDRIRNVKYSGQDESDFGEGQDARSIIEMWRKDARFHSVVYRSWLCTLSRVGRKSIGRCNETRLDVELTHRGNNLT